MFINARRTTLHAEQDKVQCGITSHASHSSRGRVANDEFLLQDGVDVEIVLVIQAHETV